MKIIIRESNREKIEKALEDIQKRCTMRNIDFDDLLKIIKDIEETLGIPKKRMLGIEADVDYNAQDFPRAYKYTPESTHIIIEKVSSGWALRYIIRDRCRSANRKYMLTLTDDAKEAIIESKMCF